MEASFTLTERFSLGGEYTWRLKDSEIRFRGSRQFAQLVNQRIPAASERIEAFRDALDLLNVWSWRNDYAPEDVGWTTMDGSAWSFAASIGDRQCQCGGTNGYPSFADTSLTTTVLGRFACLVAAMYACFDIQAFIHIAAHQRQLEVENGG